MSSFNAIELIIRLMAVSLSAFTENGEGCSALGMGDHGSSVLFRLKWPSEWWNGQLVAKRENGGDLSV